MSTAPKPAQLDRLLIITGDPSADYHAAHVVNALRAKNPAIQIAAVGGNHLKETGVALISDQSQMARIGFGAVLGAPYHFFLGRKILKFCEKFQPNAVLLIDYGVFNLWMASQLKAKGYRVYYFIPPQVWATRRGRIHKIKQHVDHVFCIFPFEEPLYQSHRIPVTYVGHPLMTQLPPPANRDAFCQKHGLDPNRKIIGLFPGSRVLEIDYLLKPMLLALPLIREAYPDVQFVLAKAGHLKPDYFKQRLSQARNPNLPDITVIESENHALLSVSDALMVASGTVTLEAALYQTPMLIMYKLHPVIYEIAVRLFPFPYLGLPNILCSIPDINQPRLNPRLPVVPEILQYQIKPVVISEFIKPLLDPNSNSSKKANAAFETIRLQLSVGSAQNQAKPAAQLVAEGLYHLI